MTSAAVQIVMLTDEQLEAEIVGVAADVCCASYREASRRLCSCGGGAAEYLERLRAEAVRREQAA